MGHLAVPTSFWPDQPCVPIRMMLPRAVLLGAVLFFCHLKGRPTIFVTSQHSAGLRHVEREANSIHARFPIRHEAAWNTALPTGGDISVVGLPRPAR